MLNYYLFSLSLLIQGQSGIVCSDEVLREELLEDIRDNGLLDCKRLIQPPSAKQETDSEANLRILAQWNSDCAFEAEYDWYTNFQGVTGLNNLVTSRGDPQMAKYFDQKDEADMCEIVRTLLHNGYFKKHNSEEAWTLKDLGDNQEQIIPQLRCAKGSFAGSDEPPGICAVNGGSYFQRDSWTILFGGEIINLGLDQQPDKDGEQKQGYNQYVFGCAKEEKQDLNVKYIEQTPNPDKD